MTLCDPMDCSLPGSSVYGILQARILKWVTILFSRESSQPRDQTRSPVLQVDSLPSEPAGKPIGIFIKLWILGKLELLWYLHLEHLYVKSVMPCQLYNQIKFLSIYLEAFFFQKGVFFFFPWFALVGGEPHKGMSSSVGEHSADGKVLACSSASPKVSKLYPLQLSFIRLLGSWH